MNGLMRVGMGYDVHKLTEGRKLILGGVDIPWEKGLLGHSDADVLIHAVMDALLGAAALGDIGKHFPDTDPAYKGISSVKLLVHVAGLLKENDYAIGNIDATIIAQKPKMAPHIPKMRENIAEALGIKISQLNIKATTEEGLDRERVSPHRRSAPCTESGNWRKSNMKIFNTLTRRKEEFVPLEEGKVKMYVCGPTVYNLIHIGNARPMIIFDTVRRYMEYKGYEVNYVSNFTDVDDKIIKKAIEEGVSAEEISTRYIKECKKDMADMNVKPATTAPQATQEIQGMIDMIQTLIDKGYAYPAADGTVYFRVKKFKDYGKLSHKNLDDLQSGFRSLKVSGEDQKEDPLDFVLWKPKKEGEPSWPSPWCDGRPGWHIECSVMSKKYLGEEIDIHAGGEDLIFPHHENEIAQSECCNGKIFARYWMHNGFLNIDNRKMSKSLGNFRTVRQIGEQYDLQVLRFFMLNAHYRSPLNFSADLMEAAKNSLERILEAAGKLSDRKDNGAAENITEEELALLKEAEGFVTKFEAAMDDDFNTADALAAIFELVKFANTNVDENSSKEFAGGLYEELFKLSDVLGLKIEKKEEILDKEIENLIQERQAARKAKDFKRADEIRDELLKKGIILKDTREGVKWQRA